MQRGQGRRMGSAWLYHVLYVIQIRLIYLLVVFYYVDCELNFDNSLSLIVML